MRQDGAIGAICDVLRMDSEVDEKEEVLIGEQQMFICIAE